MSSDNRWLRSARLELAYFSGGTLVASRARRGAGAILRFERVRPRRKGPFQPLKHAEITPRFLDQVIRKLKRWGYDIVSLDEACARAVQLPEVRRFACLTFDGAWKDLIVNAYPVLARHGVPFTVFVPTAFPDGLGEAWWLALEAVIAREARISLVIDRREQRFSVFKPAEKAELFAYLSGWLRKLPPAELSVAIRDLCSRHSVDLAALSREASMDWADINRLAADPNVTIGSATVHHPVLAHVKDAEAQREIAMGKAVLETALRRPVRHMAYPFGDAESFRRSDVVLAEQAGFVSAVTTIGGVVQSEGRTNLHMLPRIAWDGRSRSLRALKVLMTGVTLPRQEFAPRPELDLG
ncbi:putative Polysaccharide deacetylase [Bradyrhizobium sp. ORS 375]|uniref:polysaccharide deacetylase family protein n=1 Tax=Bradyrhizobium sp. (strain ORS 375) TaxID=566679 RepID=UPI000240AD42|nr:polysaccharide deacetylase family protein [Bradyrhizobium sp. ORS 375]CCD92922.1 putative Polysaccharide deacetylase [Bradyrhizobium sp. ORS 375]